MEKAGNAWRTFVWRTRRFLGVKKQTHAPVVWAASPRLQDAPSNSFSASLSSVERERLNTIVPAVRELSRIYNFFPSRVSDEDWKAILECPNLRVILQRLKYQRLKEEARMKDQRKTEERRNARAAALAVDEDEQEEKTRDQDECFIHIHPRQLELRSKELEWLRYVQSVRTQSTPQIAVDCRFLPLLTPRAANETATQLQYLISQNLARPEPWPLWYVNFQQGVPSVAPFLKKQLNMLDIPRVAGPQATSSSYTSLFDKSRIVYLSPDAEEDLEEVETDRVYVIGAIVDRTREPFIHPRATFFTAFADGVECRRLPLDKYVKWKSGSKFLTLLAVMRILQDVHDGVSWEETLLQALPVRNLRGPEEKNAFGREKDKRIRLYEKEVLQVFQKRFAKESFLL